MWQCKLCKKVVSSRALLLKHYRLVHSRQQYPCAYSDCVCVFKTWNALHSHLSRSHTQRTLDKSVSLATFNCHLCSCCNIASEQEYFSHINNHLKCNETVHCMFEGCSFKTNIYGTFKSHRNRKHNPYTLKDFKIGIANTIVGQTSADDSTDTIVEKDISANIDHDTTTSETEDLANVIELNFASLLLKLENYFHVPSIAIDELLSELHYLISCASVPLTNQVIVDILKNHNLCLDQPVIEELTKAVSFNPLLKAIEKDGTLATAFKRRQYYRKHFEVIDPIEYILDSQSKRTFQYIPILKSLQQIFKQENILNKFVTSHNQNPFVNKEKYTSYKDGLHFQNNEFFSGGELRISICLYVDDFEICNPLGTSRKKHKLCSVYWILGNLPPGSHSSLSSIYLALLCKSEDLRTFGYPKIFEPLLQDLVILEQQGVFIDNLGVNFKGTVQYVVADSLGAHGLAGFVESFSGDYFCRFCTATRSEIESKATNSDFSLRTEELHRVHIATARETGVACCGVKSSCVLADSLSFFKVTAGFPPDLAHDLFEGIVPFEIAECLRILIGKKYITFENLNRLVQSFPYKGGDQTNRPQKLPHNFLSKKTVGGNAHENWCLLRLLPLIIGQHIPENEPAWELLLDLKNIVELVVCPVHNSDSVAYLESKILDHHQRYKEVCPDRRPLPKHHFLAHYPSIIRHFGPLALLWTIRFEAKHTFFKKVARHTNCFKNITLSLSTKHQLMIGHYMHSSGCSKATFEVSRVSAVPVELLKREIAHCLAEKYPDTAVVSLAQSVSVAGIYYRKGMLIVHGSLGGLPEFAEILQMCILADSLVFIVKKLSSWYTEHYGSFKIDPSPKEISLVAHEDLVDCYPLCDYQVGASRMVTLKRYIHCSGNFNVHVADLIFVLYSSSSQSLVLKNSWTRT